MTDAAAVLDALNDDQRRAATYPCGPLLILAGAGTGKTGTLVARAAWLRGQGLQPSRILLLTFTRRAADDMLARAQPVDGGNAADRIVGGTFHAIAHRIIRAHSAAFALPAEFSVLDPADTADVLDTLRDAHGLVGTDSGRRTPRAATCAEIYSRCVSTNTALSDVLRAAYPWCVPFASQLADLFTDFVAYKRRHGLVDFDDLLLLWRAALADSAAGPALRGLFDAVLVDEYQDVNSVQADIVRLLRPDGAGLTCVGDDAQAIYAFRGADPAHLRALSTTFADLTVIRLSRNYRSRHAVLRLANVIRPQYDGLELALTAERGQGQLPQLVRCHDEATQAREICARVLAEHEAGLRFGEQAVLVRSANHSDLLELELSARGIPYVKYGGLRFTEAAHVKDFLAAARIVANPADDLAWFRLLRLHEGIGPVLARRVIDTLEIDGPRPFGRWPEAEQMLPSRQAAAVGGTIRKLARAAQLASTAERAAAILAALHDPLAARYADAAARRADLERLADAAAGSPSLHDALVQLALDPPVSTSDLAGRPRLDDDYLIISTVHSAKGLEWPVVHLPQLVDGAVPSDMALTTAAGLEEEQRLFYVAVTRARDRLFLYAPLRMHHHRRGADDRHSYAQLSRFLDAAALAHCELIDAAPPRPVLVPSAPLAASVDRDLASLWGGR